MKTLFATILISAAIILSGIAPSVAQNSEQLFQKAMMKEEGEGSLMEAIDLYKQLVDQPDAGREIKARALLQLGKCYQKLGKQEARSAFQKLIQEFGDQTELVNEARQLLSMLQAGLTGNDNASGIVMKQFWPDAGPGAQGGSLTSDGQFMSHTGSDGNLALRELSSGKTELLTKEGTWTEPSQFNVVSKISPDDKQIAYGWYSKEGIHEVHLVDIENPSPKVLYSREGIAAFPECWSPDGTKLIIEAQDLNKMVVKKLLLDVSSLETIEIPGSNMHGMGSAFFSSDGKYVFFETRVKDENNNCDLMAVSLDDLTESVLVENPANDYLLGCIPDRNDILFISDRLGSQDIWLLSVVDGKPDDEPRRILPGIGKINPIDFTENGDFYFRYQTYQYTASTAPIDENTSTIDLSAIDLFPGSNYGLEFSPSGKYIIYTKEIDNLDQPGGRLNRLHIRNNDTKEDEELIVYNRVRYPVWSADEKSLFCIGHTGNKFKLDEDNGGIYQIDVETGKFEQILSFPTIENSDGENHWAKSRVECSKDQKSLYYLFGDRIVKRELGSGKETVIVKDMPLARFLDLSKDGKKILFGTTDEANQTSTLLSMPTDGGPVDEIFTSAKSGIINNADWSSDGTKVFFSQIHDYGTKGSSIWSVSNDGQNPKKLWQTPDNITSLSINPAGGLIAVSILKHEEECWMMSNYLKD